MPDEQLPKKVFYGELQEGKCSHGGQKKRYKDTLKASQKFRRYEYLEDHSFIIGLINTKVKQHKLKLASLNNPLLATLTSLTEIKQANVNHPYNWTDIGDKYGELAFRSRAQ